MFEKCEAPKHPRGYKAVRDRINTGLTGQSAPQARFDNDADDRKAPKAKGGKRR